MRHFVIGLLIGLVIWPVAFYFYFRFAHVPVAVADGPLPFEGQIVQVPLHARITADMPKTVPIQPTPDNLLAGAQTYSKNCAGCHGTYSQPASFGQQIYPDAPQLWQAHGAHHVIGVSDDPPGETYWKVTNGIRLSAMPEFKQALTTEQRWQVSLLLANADKPLPQPVKDVLNKPVD